ncbi:LysM peptidoglycan-binding domain-containing protein [Candidatus Saccharibacteria bacterium]|nr:LysM peptidoglycan-binding domain-containing protein [Candidatus Saccharibacteria bacterium]
MAFASSIRSPSIHKQIFTIIRSRKTASTEALLALRGQLSKPDAKSRRILRFSIIGGNFLLLLLVGLFVMTNRSASDTVRASTLNGATATAASSSKPLDTLSSAQIALTAAQLARMPEMTDIHNQADSDSLILAVVPNDSTALAKPQIVSTAQKSKYDIVRYVTQSGDTVDSLSTRFGVNADSIKWSNSISSNGLTTGLKLVIPPVNGIVYTVKAGDTPASLAAKYQANEGQIITLNDAEISGLKPGEQIIVPNGRIAPVIRVTYGTYTAGISNFAASYGGNGYGYGWCTYYVAGRVAMPSNWGNANTWDDYARLSGWAVSSAPRVGAIAQTDGMSYLGHVACVEAVSPDGTMIKYSDMAGLAGWGRVGFSDWVPTSMYPHYIYH